MSSNPTTLEIENSNIPEGACVLPPNTSEGWAVAIHAAACRCVVLVNIDHTEKKSDAYSNECYRTRECILS